MNWTENLSQIILETGCQFEQLMDIPLENWKDEIPCWLFCNLDYFSQRLKQSFKQKDQILLQKKSMNESLEMCKDFVWEQLNIGHWKDVPIVYRKLYSYVTLIQVLMDLCEESPAELLKLCDNGLLMGAPICGSILTKIASVLHRKCEDSLQPFLSEPSKPRMISKLPLPGPEMTIKEISKPSLEFFHANFYSKEVPCVINGSLEHWPAAEKWDTFYILKVCGHRTVPVEIGSKYTSDDWTQKLMTIQEFYHRFLDEKAESTPVGYIAQHTLFDQIQELKDDIRIPEYCMLGDEEHVEINAWFGPGGTLTPTHYDPKHNLLAQVFGKKFIRLFPPSESSNLHPHDEDSLLFNTSQIDMEDPNALTLWPNLESIKFMDIELDSGQILYIPPRWWHMVKSLSTSFSVSFWFQ